MTHSIKALAIAAATAATMAATAQPVAAETYQCAGIGVEGREFAKTVPHNLRLVFAQPNGDYLGDVQARVLDSATGDVVTASCPGPWILLDLRPGVYEITASHGGAAKTRSFTLLGKGTQEQVFTF